MRLRGSVDVINLRGLPIRLHVSLVLALPYLTWAIAASIRALASGVGVDPASLVLPPWGLGLLLGPLVFLCVLIHELAHVWVGQRLGAHVEGVTLMLLGGVSEVARFPRTPAGELAMAIAGPLASFLIAGLCTVAIPYSSGADLRLSLILLAQVNLAVAVFNLVPAFPLDGGRVLRSLLALALDRGRATRIAVGVGQVMAVLLFILALVVPSVLLALIAVLVFVEGRAEERAVRSYSALLGLTVAEAMQRFPPTVGADEPLDPVLSRMREELTATRFVVSGDRLLGVLLAGDVSAAIRRGDSTRVRDLMKRDIPCVSPHQELWTACRALRVSGARILAVVDGKKLVGCLSWGNISDALRARAPALAGA